MKYTYSTEKKYSPHQSKFIEVENNSRDNNNNNNIYLKSNIQQVQ